MVTESYKKDNKDNIDLVQLWQDGEDERFNEIIQKYQQTIYTLCYLLLRDIQEASTITIKVFAYAYHNSYKFHDEHSLKIFLCQIGINMVRGRLQQRNTYKDELLHELLEGHKFDKPTVSWTPEEILAEKERIQEYILDNIELLPFDHMIMIILRDILLFSYEDISEIVKCSVKTVGVRLHKARIALRDRIKDVIYSGM
jgi:RNA polymerase sigma-70 factor (ECF subfamily)